MTSLPKDPITLNKAELLEWLNRNIDANRLSQGGLALSTLREELHSGTFDDYFTQEEIARIRGDIEAAEIGLKAGEEQIAKLKEERDKWKDEALLQAKLYLQKQRKANDAEDRARKAEQERDELKTETFKLRNERWEYEKGITEIHGQLSEAINALEWYGKEIIWIQGRHEGGVFFTVAEDDKGERARSIIAKLEGSKPHEP